RSVDQLGRLIECLHGPLEVSDDAIEPDPAQPGGCLELAAGFGDQHDGSLAVEDRPAPGRERSPKPDVQCAEQVGALELGRVAAVEQLGARFSETDYPLERQRLKLSLERLVEGGVLPRIELR